MRTTNPKRFVLLLREQKYGDWVDVGTFLSLDSAKYHSKAGDYIVDFYGVRGTALFLVTNTSKGYEEVT